MRYFIELAYNGAAYHGWQIQPNAHTVQAEIEAGLTAILKSPIKINGSSRTDTGVHAAQQYAHFDHFESLEDPNKLLYRLNSFLSDFVVIKRIFRVSDYTHSRFDASSRKYCYRIHQEKDPFTPINSQLFGQVLSFENLQKAAKIILLQKNFQSFSKVKTEVNNFKCDIYESEWIETESGFEYHIKANRFLRGMVRALVGTMIEVGIGKMSLEDFNAIFDKMDRTKAGRNAEAKGLTLTKVNYPKQLFEIDIRKAEASEMKWVREMFEEYSAELNVDLCFQGFQQELDSLPGIYSEPEGCILLALKENQVIGIVALKKLTEESCEMKRLYVKPSFRGLGLGKRLAKAIEIEAIKKGYKSLKLDTIERLSTAVSMYRSMGFADTEPYNYNPDTTVLYFEKLLKPWQN